MMMMIMLIGFCFNRLLYFAISQLVFCLHNHSLDHRDWTPVNPKMSKQWTSSIYSLGLHSTTLNPEMDKQLLLQKVTISFQLFLPFVVCFGPIADCAQHWLFCWTANTQQKCKLEQSFSPSTDGSFVNNLRRNFFSYFSLLCVICYQFHIRCLRPKTKICLSMI